MRALRVLSLAFFALLLASTAHADDKATAQARLDRVDAITRLDDPALKPWYMKVNFQLFDAAGKPGEQGTFEEWWAGPSLYKRTVTSPSYTATLIVNKDGKFRTSGAVETPYLLDMLEQQLVHPISPASEMTGLTPQAMKSTPGGPDCIMYSRAVRGIPFPPPGVFPTFCMAPGKDILVVSYDNGIFQVQRGAMGGFQGRVVAVDVKIQLNIQGRISVDHLDALSSHMVAMKMAPLTDADFAVPSTGMEPVNDAPLQVGYGKLKPVQPNLINATIPEHVEPKVLGDNAQVQTVYGTDGQVRWMRVINAADPRLAASAINAVLHWTIKPYLVNGKPVEVETTVEVPFSKTASMGDVGAGAH
jgi:hypothetical protein